jgi:hypothetical protein
MPKQQTTSVSHQDSEKKKEKRQKEKCIEVEIFKIASNPHAINLHKVYKPIYPEPTDSLDLQIAQWSANNSKNIRFEKWDMSRPDEPPYFRKEYMLVAETTDKNEVNELKRQIIDVEEIYETSRQETRKHLEIYAKTI